MKKHTVCIRCGRKLKTEQSQELGFGKVCWEKYNNEGKYKDLFPVSEMSNEKSK